MNRIRHFTRKTVEDLRASVPDNLDWYFAPDGKKYPRHFPADTWREKSIEAPSLSGLLKVTDKDAPWADDIENSLLVFENLKMLTPQQASQERFWTYLSHFECADYVARRWYHTQPVDPERAAARVRNHSFARDVRVLIRDHGLSRLWWLGRLATTVHREDPRLFLKILLHRQDPAWEFLGRPGVTMNIDVVRSIFKVMREHWGDTDDDRALFVKRDAFREWMKNLNRRGGVILMDALPEEPLLRLIRSEAAEALTTAPGG